MARPDYEAHLSRAARAMEGSAIRRAGDLAASVPDLISLAPGFPDATLFPWDDFREITRSLLDGSDHTVLQYGPTRGHPALLDALCEILRARGIEASTPDLLVTTGSQQALDLCARVLVDPGDVILAEIPAYTGAMTAFGNAQARVLGVRQDAEGIDLADLDRIVLHERNTGRRIAAVYVVPNFQNPTGLLTTTVRRRALLEWAGRRNVLIVEDDPYGALYFDDVTPAETRPIKADDGEGRVVYLSSFSKTVAPGFRVAWIAGPSSVVTRLEIAKQSADLCSGALDQRVILELWRRGALDRQIVILRTAYQQKRTTMERALERELHGLVSWRTPRGGFFLWAEFPPAVTTDALIRRATAKGVLFVPGSAFDAGHRPSRHARLAFAAPSNERIEIGIQRLAAAVEEELRAADPRQRAVTERRS